MDEERWLFVEWVDSRNFFPEYDVINSNTLLEGTPKTEIYIGNMLFFLYKSLTKARKAKIISVSENKSDIERMKYVMDNQRKMIENVISSIKFETSSDECLRGLGQVASSRRGDDDDSGHELTCRKRQTTNTSISIPSTLKEQSTQTTSDGEISAQNNNNSLPKSSKGQPAHNNNNSLPKSSKGQPAHNNNNSLPKSSKGQPAHNSNISLPVTPKELSAETDNSLPRKSKRLSARNNNKSLSVTSKGLSADTNNENMPSTSNKSSTHITNSGSSSTSSE